MAKAHVKGIVILAVIMLIPLLSARRLYPTEKPAASSNADTSIEKPSKHQKATQARKVATIKTPIGNKRPTAPDEAELIIKRFVTAKSIKLARTSEFPGKRKTYEFEYDCGGDDPGVVWFDVKAGIVTGVVGPLKEDPVDQKDLPLTKQAAVQRAEAFVKDKYPWFDELTLDKVESLPNSTYSIFWQAIDENGARLPMWVTISIETKTGMLGSYGAGAMDTTISTKPKITKAQAIKQVKLSKEDTLESCRLGIAIDKNGTQHLVWSIDFIDRVKGTEGYVMGGQTITIDAKTGKDITRELY